MFETHRESVLGLTGISKSANLEEIKRLARRNVAAFESATIGMLEDPLSRRLVLTAGVGAPFLAGLGAMGNLKNEIKNLKTSEEEKNKQILDHYGLEKVPMIPYKGFENAAYIEGKNFKPSLFDKGVQEHDPVLKKYVSKNPHRLEDLRNHGAIIYDKSFNKPAINAHEAGHAQIGNEDEKSLSRLNQEVFRPASSIVGGLLGNIAGWTTGGLTGHPLSGAVAGGLTGAVFGAPTLINEIEATNRAKSYIDAHMTPEEAEKSKRALNAAFGTYLLGSTVGPAVLGALGGAFTKARLDYLD